MGLSQARLSANRRSLAGAIGAGILVPGGLSPTIVSASVRVAPAVGAASSNSSSVQAYRFFDYAITDCQGISPEFWNGGVVATGTPQEQASGSALPIAVSILTGVSDPSAADQSAATLTRLTWAKAIALDPEYIYKLDGTTPTQADGAAAGLAISSDNYTLTVPSGWAARPDAGPSVVAGTIYGVQCEVDVSGGKSFNTGAVSCQSSLGDRRVLNSAGICASKVWASASGFTGPGFGPAAIWATDPKGRRTTLLAGDSITRDNADAPLGSTSITGDAVGAQAWGARSLRAAGIPFVKISISGDSPKRWYDQGGNAVRRRLARYCSNMINAMGANISGSPWSASLSSGGFLALMRWYSLLLRGSLKAGNGRVAWCQMWPGATSTDNFATTANMTATSGPGSTRYDSYHPWLAAGVFDRTLGDPDAVINISDALYTFAIQQGYDVDSGRYKPPANGQAVPSALYHDTTHPKQPLMIGVASLVAPTLKDKLAA